MRTLFITAVTAAILGGCAAPMSQQLNELDTSAACCTELAQLATAGTLGSDITGSLSPQTPLSMINGKRSPALRYLVPAGLAGRELLIRIAPKDPGTFARRDGMAFAPVAIGFFAADGSSIAPAANSDFYAGPAQSIAYSYALYRRVTVPAGAASAVIYSDPARYGTAQVFDYRFSAQTAAAGIPLAMSANARGAFKVFGDFSVKAQ